MPASHASLLKAAKRRARVARAAIGLREALSSLLGRDVPVDEHHCTGQGGASLVCRSGVSLRLDDVEAIVAKLEAAK